MNCQDVQERVGLYCLGDLDSDERREIQAHLSTGCPRCAASLAETDAAMSHLAELLSPIEPPSHLKRQLLGRLRSDKSSSPLAPVATARGANAMIVSSSQSRRLVSTAIWSATAGALICAIVIYAMFAHPLILKNNELRQAQESNTDQTVRIQRLTGQLQLVNESYSLLQSSSFEFIRLHSGDEAETADGHVLWDKTRHELHCYVFGLSREDKTRTYSLRLSTVGRSIGVETVEPDEDGDWAVVAPIPHGFELITRIAIVRRRAGERQSTSKAEDVVVLSGHPKQ